MHERLLVELFLKKCELLKIGEECWVALRIRSTKVTCLLSCPGPNQRLPHINQVVSLRPGPFPPLRWMDDSSESSPPGSSKRSIRIIQKKNCSTGSQRSLIQPRSPLSNSCCWSKVPGGWPQHLKWTANVISSSSYPFIHAFQTLPQDVQDNLMIVLRCRWRFLCWAIPVQILEMNKE